MCLPLELDALPVCATTINMYKHIAVYINTALNNVWAELCLAAGLTVYIQAHS